MLKSEKISFTISTLAILAGLILTIVSALHLCSESCAPTQNYRILGLDFSTFGLVFFPLLLGSHLLSKNSPLLSYITGAMVASALGAEIQMIVIQKREIGQWCPVCLSIAFTLLIVAGCYSVGFLRNLKQSIDNLQKEKIMQNLTKGASSIALLFVGFFIAFFGISKVNPLDAIETSIKESIVFGNKESPVDIYIFTDWACPACRQLEPELEKSIPTFLKQARLTFVDFTVHPETLNFVPYNLSFMINNKNAYLKLRHALTALSVKTGTPTEDQIEKIAHDSGVKFKLLNFADVSLGNKYFKHLGTEFGINSTPTMVIVNRTAKKGKKLYGGSQITEENVLKAIETLKTIE